MKDLIDGQPEQDIEHCATCIHAADSEDICILRKCKYAIAELKDCYEPEQRWIPLSEKFPQKNDDVLLQFPSNQCVGYYEDGDWMINTGDGICSMIGYDEEKPIAWMPLPEPYKGGEHETD